MDNFVYGTPSLEESKNLWKRFLGEADVTRDEYEAAAKSLGQHIATQYALYDHRAQGDVYVRGDFTGDRTQCVELYVPELISREFIAHLQLWLRDYEDGAWRIVIPTYVGDSATILVYPDTVRLGDEWTADFDDAYRSIPQMMRARDQHGTDKRST
jgi:hypothetical protein